MRIGIIGAGQLGQMLGFAARTLEYECRFVDPSPAPPAAVAGEVIRAAYDDANALMELARGSDVVTYEFENVPVGALEALVETVSVYPPTEALRLAQDRLAEKRLFDELGIPLAPYETIDSRVDLARAAASLGLPLVVKTRRLGYDGKGQYVIADASQIDAAWRALDGRAAIAEAWVRFDFEVSAIGARGPRGNFGIWPLTQNEHRGGILRVSRAPAGNEAVSRLATRYVRKLMDRLDYVGVLALEMFVLGDRLLANEYAPRVHNSGHWTIEGARTSQFTNHLLAITGRSLRPTDARGFAGMVNLIGTIPDAVRELVQPGVYLHDYGKEPRPGRKLGHVTVVAESEASRDRLLSQISQTVTESTSGPGSEP